MVAKGILGFVVLTALPTAAETLGIKDTVSFGRALLTHVAKQTSVHEKDQSRIPAHLETDDGFKSNAPVQVAQKRPLEGGQMPPALPGHSPLQFPPQRFHPSEHSNAYSAACEDEASRKSALVGYLKSKLRLREAQREAWLRLERAADAAIERLHVACDDPDMDTSSAPDMVDRIDGLVRKLSADAEFLQAIREPVRALYKQLSPKQRLILQPLGFPEPPL